MEQQGSLSYGVVVKRLEGGNWWHGHMVRSDLEYYSGLLGRRTSLLFLMTIFGSGATRKSRDFYLTLDGEGVAEQLLPIRFNADWGERDDDMELKVKALEIQNNILPQLFDSNHFQAAMAAIVYKQMYEKVADATMLSRISDRM